MRSSATLASAAALALALGLSACASPSTSATPAPSTVEASAAPTSSPSTEATDDEVDVDRIVFRADGFDILATDGAVIETSSILEDGTAILDAFEAAFGTEPQESAYAGGIESQPGTVYSWGGLQVYVGETPYNYFDQDISVEITASDIGDVDLVSAEGASVGAPRDELDGSPAFESLNPDEFVLLVEPITVGTAEEAGFPGDHPDGDLVWSIAVYGDATGVTKLFLTSENYGV